MVPFYQRRLDLLMDFRHLDDWHFAGVVLRVEQPHFQLRQQVKDFVEPGLVHGQFLLYCLDVFSPVEGHSLRLLCLCLALTPTRHR